MKINRHKQRIIYQAITNITLILFICACSNSHQHSDQNIIVSDSVQVQINLKKRIFNSIGERDSTLENQIEHVTMDSVDTYFLLYSSLYYIAQGSSTRGINYLKRFVTKDSSQCGQALFRELNQIVTYKDSLPSDYIRDYVLLYKKNMKYGELGDLCNYQMNGNDSTFNITIEPD